MGKRSLLTEPLRDARPNLDRREALPYEILNCCGPAAEKISGAGQLHYPRSRPLEPPPLPLRAV
jgi:hypothetical protein